jgi:signal transduction histidine kinase
VNNILFLSRLDARMIEFSTQPTDFAASFEVHCHNGWTPYKKPGVDYIIDRSYRHFITDVDDTNLGIVIVNIVANAAQFTDKGSVHASYGYTGDYLVITVDDTGCGIPEQELSHIFERFATGANNGTGLGLSICYELVHQMGGSINIKSEVGKGTTVWVTIPCQVSEIER